MDAELFDRLHRAAELVPAEMEEEDEHRRTGERRKPGLDAISEKTN